MPNTDLPHTLSLAHLSVIELTPPEVISAAAEAGFRSVNVRIAPVAPGEAQHPVVGDTPMRRETLLRMRDTGVKVHDVEIIRLMGDTDTASFEPLLDTAAVLGAQYMLVAGDDPDENAMADRFAEVCERAERFGIRIGLEFMPWTGIKDINAASRVVSKAGKGHVIVDTLHLDRSGGTAADIAALPSQQHAYFQLCDGPAERPMDDATLIHQAREARLPPGQGGIDLVAMAAAIPRGMTVSVEVPMKARAATEDAVTRARLLHETASALMSRAGRTVE